MSRAKEAEHRETKRSRGGPTVRMTGALDQVYEHFNASLFESELPPLFGICLGAKAGTLWNTLIDVRRGAF
jgi:hypothetical protein